MTFSWEFPGKQKTQFVFISTIYNYVRNDPIVLFEKFCVYKLHNLWSYFIKTLYIPSCLLLSQLLLLNLLEECLISLHFRLLYTQTTRYNEKLQVGICGHNSNFWKIKLGGELMFIKFLDSFKTVDKPNHSIQPSKIAAFIIFMHPTKFSIYFPFT